MNYPKNRYTEEKPWMDKEWLYNEYVVKDRSTQEIADEYGCKRNTIQCWLVKHGIKKSVVKRKQRSPKYPEITKEFLEREHLKNGKSMAQIAEETGASQDTIREYMKRYNIDYWQTHPKHFLTETEMGDVIEQYTTGNMSANKIAEQYNTSHSVIIRALKRYNIETRGTSDSQFVANNKEKNPLLDDPEWLEKMHWVDGKSCVEIGAMLGCGGDTVRRHMHKYGIRTKTNSESKLGIMAGESHPNWKGGITDLNRLLREYFNTNLSPKAAKRDDYTCQLCGVKHVVLHVHHIRPFSEIIAKILDEHPMLDPNDVEDKLELYEIITHDSRFLDEDNLITFCKDCHLFKIHNYKRKATSSQALKGEGSETISV